MYLKIMRGHEGYTIHEVKDTVSVQKHWRKNRTTDLPGLVQHPTEDGGAACVICEVVEAVVCGFEVEEDKREYLCHAFLFDKGGIVTAQPAFLMNDNGKTLESYYPEERTKSGSFIKE